MKIAPVPFSGSQGGHLETLTDLYIFQSRDYDPQGGGWMEQDPAGYINGMNTYQLEASRPSDSLGPTGLSLENGVIEGAHSALVWYEFGFGKPAIISSQLVDDIKQFDDYKDKMTQIALQIGKVADNTPAPGKKDFDQDYTLTGSKTVVPINNTYSLAFLIGTGTLELNWTTKFHLHISKDDSCGKYTIVVSKQTVDWNLHKLYSFDQKPTTAGNIVNYPFHFFFGTFLGGSDYWLNGDWNDTPPVGQAYTNGNLTRQDPNWHP